MKKILIISYFFPPLGGPGVQRVLKFVKYLPDFGWEPIVLTVKNIEYIAYDKSLLKEIPNAQIHRTESLDPMRLLYFLEKFRNKKSRIYTETSDAKRSFFRDIFPIDSKIGWLPFAYHEGCKLIKENAIDALFATVGPYSSSILGYKLAEKFHIPLIIDYRDLWKGKPDISYYSKFHQRFSDKYERRSLEAAAKVIVCTKSMKSQLQFHFPKAAKSKIDVIFNGWDKQEFDKVKPDSKSQDKFVITYTGGFYGEQTPKFFIDAVSDLILENKLPENTEIRFVGNFYKCIKDILSIPKLKKVMKIIPQVSHQESIRYMKESDVLLLFIAKENSDSIITQKLFEYLAVQKLILAMIPVKGDASKILQETNTALISEIDDINEIKSNIIRIIEISRNGNKIFDFSENMQFERKSLTGKLAEILNKL